MHFGDLSHVAHRANCSYHSMLGLRAMASVTPMSKSPSICLGALFRKHGATGTLTDSRSKHTNYRHILQYTLTQNSAPHCQMTPALTVTFYGYRRSPSTNEHR